VELPGLALLAERAPEAAARLQQIVQRLLLAVDADRWAADRVRALAEAFARGEALDALVTLVREEAGTEDVWAVILADDAGVRVRAVAGRGGSPPDPEVLSQTLLRAVAERGSAVWLDESGEVAAAASIVAGHTRVHGAVPLGARGVVYLAGGSRRIDSRGRRRIESLCRIAGGFVDAAPPAPRDPPMVPGMVGRSRVMQELAQAVRGFAAVPWPALILGETGTGKELVARALHDLSPRAGGPFVAANCAAIPETLAESTLFGHERGAFTGADRRREGLVERAHGGTLFLDEVGELPLPLQAKLLRVLQEVRYERVGGERELRFEGRVVAATHRPLAQGDGSFRADLFHRLGACVIRVPPLRERPEDVRVLATHLLGRAMEELPGLPEVTLSDGAVVALEQRAWPGNVRELDNVLKASLAAAVSRGLRVLQAEDLADPAGLAAAPPATAPATSVGAAGDGFRLVGPQGEAALPAHLQPALDQVQRALVQDALRQAGGKRPAAATRLGVSRQWLHTLLRRWEGGADR
jgi:DNA-binding NtrC family response regulator